MAPPVRSPQLRAKSPTTSSRPQSVTFRTLPEDQANQNSAVKAFHIFEWIEENKSDFQPPVCNKCMYEEQLKVFFVGGPNSRRDYHLEEGEEFFFQKTGDMVLKVIEKGVMKDIVIREGEIFLLPSRVEHSPQRFSNTIGFVVERTRMNTEFDCVRYFMPNSNVRLWERWIHLTDVVKDLPPVITSFNQSEQCKNSRPGDGSFIISPPYEPRYTDLPPPINLHKFIDINKHKLTAGPVQIYGAPEYLTEVILLGRGTYEMDSGPCELLLWTQDNSFAVLWVKSVAYPLQSDAMARIKEHTECVLEIKYGYAVSIRMPKTKIA